MRHYEGTLEIDGTDFFLWALCKYDFHENAILGDPKFSKENNDIYLLLTWKWDGSEEINQVMDMVEFWVWLMTFLPDSGDEILFDLPVWDKKNQMLVVKYAGSNICHPSTWSTPPSFLK
jgi:hypothetical protein